VKELSPESPPLVSAGTSQQDEAASSPGDTYTMKNGDSLYGIAVRHRISLAQLQEINNLTDPRKVRAGTVLKLPSSSAAPTRVALTPDRRPQLGSQADTTNAPQAAAASSNDSSEAVAKPTIINAPASAPGQRMASLDNTGTASDAAPSPLTLPSPSAEGESGKASEPQGSGATKAETVGKFRWPVRGKVITGFGQQPDGSHSDGIKLAVPLGTEVHAAESGVVAYAGNELKGYGNLVLLRHDNGWITAYAHNDELSVKRGDRVRRGQVIAKAGNTGSTDRPQLHFELRQGSSPVDPVPHLERL
jgi:murein DD-endopeptidase MepM/ murein hydrolase activator NlpD